jgi:hypothetical protein
MLQQLLARSRSWRRGKTSNAAQIAARIDAVEDDFCLIVSELALVSRDQETRIKMPIVQIAADGNLTRNARRRRPAAPR